MMNARFNKLCARAIGTAALVALILPASLSASKALGQTETGGTTLEGRNFCANVSARTAELEERIAAREAKITARKDERVEKLEQRKAERLEQRDERQERWDAKRAELHAKLEAQATTQEQKDAVVAFRVALDAAIAGRKAAIEAAQEAFRLERDRIFAARQEAVLAAAANFKNSVQAAIAKAKADCASGADPASVRATFRSSLNTARDQFASDRQALEQHKTDLRAAIETRNAAVRKAIEDFKAAVRAAADTLKAAFPAEPSPTSTPPIPGGETSTE